MMNRTVSNYVFQMISWVIVYLLFGIPLYFVLLNFPKEMVNTYLVSDFWPGFIMDIMCGVLMGLVMGSLDLLIQKVVKKKQSFRKVLLIKSGIYALTFIVVACTISLIWFGSHKDLSLTEAIGALRSGVATNVLIAYFVLNMMSSILISFIAQLSDMAGREKLWPMLTGRYYAPREEQRIFMFLDLRASTTLAEKLGHVLFSQLIQDCFYDLNQVIGKYKAIIYQYVGDEAVLTWRQDEGIKNLNCLHLFYAFQEQLSKNAVRYQAKYGVVPEFKAGVNIGAVTVAEIGKIKKEIAFHGDVLNTAARIQGLCNQYDKKLLISEFLEEELAINNGFKREYLGEMELKGRVKPVRVYGVEA